MDKNSAIGFGLLVALLIGYFSYSSYEQKKYKEQHKADSIAYAKAHPELQKSQSAAQSEATKATVALDSTQQKAQDSLNQLLPSGFRGTAQNIRLENEKISLDITSQGAYPTAALLKEFKTYSKKPLYLFKGDKNKLELQLPGQQGAINTANLFFSVQKQEKNSTGQSLELIADIGEGKKVQYNYFLPANSYMLQFSIQLHGITAGSNLPLAWHLEGLSTEKDVYNERMATQIYYHFKDEDKDYFTVNEEKSETLDKPVSWLGYRQLYFSSALIADDAFSKIQIKSSTKLAAKDITANSSFNFELPAKAGSQQQYAFKWYIGPNDYNTLKAFHLHLEDMVPYGFGIFTFVKYINKWLLLPLFTFLTAHVGSIALVIVLMTIIIRLALSFFTYKSFLSTAKMRALKPELDELREKCGDDKQKMSMEQMNLYRTAGVNPLGGCLPMLFQLPILLSLYYFIPTALPVRQASFLWADDLSTYDSIASWSTQIPILSSLYGNHVSLFTLLMTASSLLLALYSKNNTPQDPNNPMMKWMPFVFPFFLMGFFNKMAAALTFYYFLSNMLSLLQQYIIQKFFINEEKLHAQIQENKSKPAAQSKWAERIAEIQKQQQAKLKK